MKASDLIESVRRALDGEDIFNPEHLPDTICDECGTAFYAGIGASVVCDGCLAKRPDHPIDLVQINGVWQLPPAVVD